MKRVFPVWLIVSLLAISCEPMFFGPDYTYDTGTHRTDIPAPRLRPTSFFVATDRHDGEDGNHLTEMLRIAVEGTSVTPSVVLLGGDYVGHGGGENPEFPISDLYDEVGAVLPRAKVLMTYGSHDINCTDGYDAFFSGPYRANAYYIYGISFAQMIYATDAEKYKGLDLADPYGASAASATEHFLTWAASLTDQDPIVVMSHVPLHADRGDNHGAAAWLDALNTVSATHDIIFLWGHNHSIEGGGPGGDRPTPPDNPDNPDNPDRPGKPDKPGNGDAPQKPGNPSLERYNYLLAPGDSITVQGPADTLRTQLDFTYVNAGYLTNGVATVITFYSDTRQGVYDNFQLERFALEADDREENIGLTGYHNPYVGYFKPSKRGVER